MNNVFFTTVGKLNHFGWTAFRSAMASWVDRDPDSHIIVYGDEGDSEVKQFVEWSGAEFRTDVERTEFGLPIVRSMFTTTENTYPDWDVYTYINSDIILTKSLQPIIDKVSEIGDQFMLVGQRMDLIGYPKENAQRQLHNPGGIDYFCYTKGFWYLDDMPDFSVARGRFDHYLMGRALRHGNGPVIDITKDFLVMHPEPENRLPGDVSALYQRGEFALGYQVLRNHYHFSNARLHGQTNYAPYKLVNGELQKDKTIYKDEFNQVIENDILL